MNNKLPLIKEKSFLYENKDETKSKLMNTMTQEIMTNFKKKIHQLESDNKKLKKMHDSSLKLYDISNRIYCYTQIYF